MCIALMTDTREDGVCNICTAVNPGMLQRRCRKNSCTPKRNKRSKNNINLSINDARKNGELVSVGANQVIRSIFKIRGIEYSQEKLDSLFDQKKKWSKNKPSDIVAHKIGQINKEIDEILFLPEICSVVIINKSHYKKGVFRGKRKVWRPETYESCKRKIK